MTVAVRVSGVSGGKGESTSVEVRMEVKRTTLVEITGGATGVGVCLVVSSGKAEVAEMSKGVVATIVEIVVVTMGTADGDEAVI